MRNPCWKTPGRTHKPHAHPQLRARPGGAWNPAAISCTRPSESRGPQWVCLWPPLWNPARCFLQGPWPPFAGPERGPPRTSQAAGLGQFCLCLALKTYLYIFFSHEQGHGLQGGGGKRRSRILTVESIEYSFCFKNRDSAAGMQVGWVHTGLRLTLRSSSSSGFSSSARCPGGCGSLGQSSFLFVEQLVLWGTANSSSKPPWAAVWLSG